MTVVTTADTSQLYALAARLGLRLHGPLTVNELLGSTMDHDRHRRRWTSVGAAHPAPGRR